jgi:outer membrane receptor protein involved in Fe transport
MPVAPERNFSMHVDMAYRSDVNTSVNDLQYDTTNDVIVANTYSTNFRHLGGFTTLNASVGMQATRQLKVRLYCNNITNQLGITTWSVARQPEQSTEYLSRPRTAGVNLQYNFTR